MEKDMFIIKKIGQMNVPEGNCHSKSWRNSSENLHQAKAWRNPSENLHQSKA